MPRKDIAVDSTPERSFSLLLSSARSGGDDRMRARVIGCAEMVGGHHPPERRDEAPLRIGEKGRDAGERLLLFAVEDVQDGPDEQTMAGLLPMIAPFERSLGIDEDVGDILDVAHLLRAAATLQQGIVTG